MAELVDLAPATGEVCWRGSEASPEEVTTAVDSARDAFAPWAGRSLVERLGVIEAFAARLDAGRDELARVIATETGKPRWEADTEVTAMIAKVGHSRRAYDIRTPTTAEDLGGGIRASLRHRPHGVAAVFGPYNFPGHLPNGHIVPALLAGNTIVWKPSEHTPWTAEVVAGHWRDAGLDPGVLTVVQGGPRVGEVLIGQTLDAVLFTGSARVGRLLHHQLAGRPETLLALEMGGNNPLVLCPVDDLDGVVHLVVQSSFLSAGQRCTCARRVMVPQGAWGDAVVDRLVWAATGLRQGGPFDEPAPFLGPVISTAAADALLVGQAQLLDRGARPLLLAERRPHAFVTPGIIDVSGRDDVPDEELFGPLVQIRRYDGLDAAIAHANDTEFGLSAGIVTDDPVEWDRFRDRIRAGIVNWNRPLTGASSGAPFGGVGWSGNHRPSALYAADYSAYPVASLESDSIVLPLDRAPGLPW